MTEQADEHAARELELFIHSDSSLYKQQLQPIQKNLATYVARRVYDHEKGVKQFMYLMDAGAKKYAKEFGSESDNWFEMFNKATRELAAKSFAKEFEGENSLGNYDYLLPKKYQKKEKVSGYLR